MIRTLVLAADQPAREADLDEVTIPGREDDVTLWIDVLAPTDDEMAGLADGLRLDRRAVARVRRNDRLPGVRFFGDHFVVTALAVDVDETRDRPRIRVGELDAIVGPGYLVTLHQEELPFAEELTERVEANPQLGRFDAPYLLYVLIDTLIGHYARELDEIEDEALRLEEQLLRDPGRRALGRNMVLKRHIRRVQRLVGPHRAVFGALVGADSPITEQMGESYFRDLLQRFDAVGQRIEHLHDIVIGSVDLYLSNISHRTSQQLRVLTFLSVVLLPMTAIAGIFGTNFKLSSYDAWEPFYVMLVGMILIAGGMLTFFRVRGWL